MDCKDAKPRVDFLQYLTTDMSLYIMSFLHDPADLVRATSVSRFWCQFVIENAFAKELCLKTFSGSSNILGTVNQSKGKKWDYSLQTDHEVYAALLYAFQKSKNRPFRFISGIRASSTSGNNSIAGTKYPYFLGQPTYWSSNGHSNTNVPETLTFKIERERGIMAITKIRVSPWREEGSPFCFSAKSVRFIVGHSKSPRENETDPIADDEIEWTYTSPEFPMKHRYSHVEGQEFKLSQPVLCFDGYLKIELLGRVQRDQEDGLFYIRVDCVGARGHRLFASDAANIHQRYGKAFVVLQPYINPRFPRYRQPRLN